MARFSIDVCCRGPLDDDGLSALGDQCMGAKLVPSIRCGRRLDSKRTPRDLFGGICDGLHRGILGARGPLPNSVRSDPGSATFSASKTAASFCEGARRVDTLASVFHDRHDCIFDGLWCG
jgi:hypothetical protein